MAILFMGLILYVLSYLIWSRVRIASADKQGIGGYYFVEPSTAARELAHIGCYIVYWPLVEIERRLGTGRQPASLPMDDLDPPNNTKLLPDRDCPPQCAHNLVPFVAYCLLAPNLNTAV